MRLPALSVVVLGLGLGCGHIGYDNAASDGGADAVDAPDLDAPAGVLATCGQAVQVVDFGSAESASFYGLDVTSTDAGFLVAWSGGADMIRATGLAVNEGPRLEVIQTSSDITAKEAATLSIAAIGDDAMLGVDDPGGPGIWLFSLDLHGYERGTTKYIDTHRAYGHAFVEADPVNDLFLVMGSDGAATAIFQRDHDIHPYNGPDPAFPVATESAAAVPMPGGYVLMTGNSSNCDVVRVDNQRVPLEASQAIAMTCHHASLVKVQGSADIVAAWNCDNDQVWLTAGDPAAQLPPYRSVAGDGTTPASNPRLGPTSDGIWYGYEISGGLGRTLVDAAGATVSGAEPQIVHSSPAIKAYDLAVHQDTAFLFWLESASRTELWAMKLCAP
jgi:hypothetical protein